MKLINFSSVFCSTGWSILSIGWWVKKDVLLVSSEGITAVTLIFFKAVMTPSCVIRPGMWGNCFPSNFQFLIVSNKNIISSARSTVDWMKSDVSLNWEETWDRTSKVVSTLAMVPMFRHVEHRTKIRPGGVSYVQLKFPTDFSNKLILQFIAALHVFFSKPRTDGIILAIKRFTKSKFST